MLVAIVHLQNGHEEQKGWGGAPGFETLGNVRTSYAFPSLRRSLFALFF